MNKNEMMKFLREENRAPRSYPSSAEDLLKIREQQRIQAAEREERLQEYLRQHPETPNTTSSPPPSPPAASQEKYIPQTQIERRPDYETWKKDRGVFKTYFDNLRGINRETGTKGASEYKQTRVADKAKQATDAATSRHAAATEYLEKLLDYRYNNGRTPELEKKIEDANAAVEIANKNRQDALQNQEDQYERLRGVISGNKEIRNTRLKTAAVAGIGLAATKAALYLADKDKKEKWLGTSCRYVKSEKEKEKCKQYIFEVNKEKFLKEREKCKGDYDCIEEVNAKIIKLKNKIDKI